MSTENKFYDLQRQSMNDDAFAVGREKVHESWFNEHTVDFWRHKRMYDTIAPLASFYDKGNWLTIGDGRYGLDSIRLKKLFGIKNILPTDISSNMLEESKSKGLIEDYRVENAEKLSFADNTFDIVFCKEAYHHFPRAIMALYDMIRVSKGAVVLIEPIDYPVCVVKRDRLIKILLKGLISKLLGKPYEPFVASAKVKGHGFEGSGNYVYEVSLTEMERVVQGIDLGGMAWIGFNDHYVDGCEFEPAVNGNKVFEETKREIEKRNNLCARYPGEYAYGMGTVIIFKNEISPDMQKKLTAFGYRFMSKVNNPAIEKTKGA
jgi:hypothetical protein